MALGREPGLAGGGAPPSPPGSEPRTQDRLVICTATEETATTVRQGGFNMAWTRALPPTYPPDPAQAAKDRRPSPLASPLFLYFWGSPAAPPPRLMHGLQLCSLPPPLKSTRGGERGQEGREKELEIKGRDLFSALACLDPGQILA